MERIVKFGVTFYTCDWPEHLVETREVLVGLIDAGLPGSLEIVLEVPLTRVSRQYAPDGGWLLEVAVPGDDDGTWQSTIEDVIAEIGAGS